MKTNNKIFFNFLLIIAIFVSLSPVFVLAQTEEIDNLDEFLPAEQQSLEELNLESLDYFIVESVEPKEEFFEAEVTQVIEEREKQISPTQTIWQQNLKLKGLEGSFKDEEIFFNGISDLEVLASDRYQVGDKVTMAYVIDYTGSERFYVLDYVRRADIYWFFLIFAACVILVGGWKGLRSLIVLALTFLIILKFIIPQILAGASPLNITLVGSFVIVFLAIYLTEGFNKKSSLAVLSIALALIITAVLAYFSTKLMHLSGISEEALFLSSYGFASLDFKGILLAGIIIGALGVLDDVVISQVSVVKEIYAANKNLNKKEVYKSAMKVGVSHINAMVNTLFLAYAGVSFILLFLFSIKQEPFLSYEQIINQEVIATEIVRSLVGAIGLILSVPISTYLGVLFLKSKSDDKKNEDKDFEKVKN